MCLVAHLIVFLSFTRSTVRVFCLGTFCMCSFWFQLYIVHYFDFQTSASVNKRKRSNLNNLHFSITLQHESVLSVTHYLIYLETDNGMHYSLFIPCYGMLNNLILIIGILFICSCLSHSKIHTFSLLGGFVRKKIVSEGLTGFSL